MSRDTPEMPDHNLNRDSDRPIDVSRFEWPNSELGPIEKMRALAAGLPHVASKETVFDVPFDRFWSYLTDFEANTAKFEGTVAEVRVLERRPEGDSEGERIVLDARGPLFGPWMRFDVVVRPGWCLMRSRFGEIGMAARPNAPNSTHYLHFEGSTLLGRIGRPFFAWNIKQDFSKLRALLG
jgi:hypothetical protein